MPTLVLQPSYDRYSCEATVCTLRKKVRTSSVRSDARSYHREFQFAMFRVAEVKSNSSPIAFHESDCLVRSNIYLSISNLGAGEQP
jgi:hypothetical protein